MQKLHVYLIAVLLTVSAGNRAAAQSQSVYSSIVGSVTDPSAAAIAGARVTATNSQTNLSYYAQSDNAGFYRIDRLTAGSYNLEIQREGFKTFKRQNLKPTTAQTLRVDAVLEVGQVSEKVEVTAETPLIETDTPQISSVKSWDLRKFLPTASNDFYSTLALDPGATTANPGFFVSFAGSLQSQYDYAIDGQTFRSPYAGHNAMVANFNEWQQEVKTSYVNNSAEYSSLAVVNATTKSGSNRFHGSGVWYYNSGGLRARNSFSPVAPSGVDQRFATSLGGPIRRDRAFFFVAYSGDRNHSAITNTATVPSNLMRQGNLSEVSGTIVDPATGAPFPNNLIPANRISPVAAAFMNRFYPAPNFGTAFAGGNYRALVPQAPAEDDLFTRIDQRISDRHSIFVRYSYDEGNRGGLFTGSLPTVGFRQGYRRDQNAVLSDLFSFSPNIYNEFSTGWTRDHNLIKGSTYGPDVAKLLGIQGIKTLPIPAIPAFNIQGFTSVSQQSLQDIAEDIFSVRDNLSWVIGRHRAKFGFTYANGRAAQIPFSPDNSYGNFGFTNSFATGNSFANFLLGIPTTIYRLNPDYFDRVYLRDNTYQLFAQDDVQISRKLTVNVGLRYEYHQPWKENNGRQYTFDPVKSAIVVPSEAALKLISPAILQSGNFTVLTAGRAGYPDRLVETTTLGFAPRIGAAYRFSDRTVLRAGWGIFYDFNPPNQTSIDPFIASQSYPNNQIVNGSPLYQFPNPFPAQALPSGTLSLNAAAKHLRMPYSEQGNVTVEHQLTATTAFRLSWVSTKGLQQIYIRDINRPAAGVTPFSQDRRPYPQYGPISLQDNGAGHTYESGQASFQYRGKHGLYFNASYTLAKDVGINEAGGSFATVSIQDPSNRNLDRGDSLYIPRHQFVSLYNYELPFGRGKRFASSMPSLLQYIVGGWQTTGVYTAKTGQYLTPTYSGYDATGTGVLGGRPDRLADGNLPSGQRSVSLWFDPNAFAIPGAAAGSPRVAPGTPVGRYGNAGVGIIQGPGLWQYDVGLVKNNAITEHARLSLFFLGTNIFNHPNPGNPNMDITSPNLAGRIFSVQTDSNASGIGPRRVTLGMRLEF